MNKPVVMILAAGRGQRMQPLTDVIPKPLLLAKGFPLIGYQIEKFTRFGVENFVINISHLEEVFYKYFRKNGDSVFANLGVKKVNLSSEQPRALETASGIAKALPLINENNGNSENAPFFVVSSDAFLETDFEKFYAKFAEKLQPGEAALLLVKNPEHNPNGDFYLAENGKLQAIPNRFEKVENTENAENAANSENSENVEISDNQKSYTYSGIGIFTPKFFDGVNPRYPLKLNKLFVQALAEQRLYGEFCDGFWLDIGTPQRLQDFCDYLDKTGIPPRIIEFCKNNPNYTYANANQESE